MIRLVLALSVPVLVTVGGLQPSGSSTLQNSLTAQEQTDGWTLLFDGRTTNGWKGFGKKAFPTEGWVVEAGTLKGLGKKGGDIITTSCTATSSSPGTGGCRPRATAASSTSSTRRVATPAAPSATSTRRSTMTTTR